MSTKIQKTQEAFRGTPLEGREITSVPIAECGDEALAIRVRSGEAEPLWRAARDVIHLTGRWPVVVTDWTADLAQLFTRFPFDGEPLSSRTGNAPLDVIDASLRLDIAGELAKLGKRSTEDPRDWIEHFVTETTRTFGQAPTEDAVEEAIGRLGIASLLDLEVWFFEWEQATFGGKALEIGPPHLRYLTWFAPNDDETALVLLPTPNGWDVPAYLSWFGSESASSELVVALLRDWHERFGAELVCHYGTMLQLVTSRLPQTPAEAMQLAGQQHAIAPCTTILPGVSVRDHARSLLHTQRWFLHERP